MPWAPVVTGIRSHPPAAPVTVADVLDALTSRIDRRAVRDALPLAVPAVPFGFVVGLAITESAMPGWIAYLSAPLVFAGAAQLAMITLAGTATIWAIIAAVLVINTRHLMYSAALAPKFRGQPRWMRWFAPFLLVDQVFALAAVEPGDDPVTFRRYYLTAAVILYGVWNVVVPLGMVVGPIVPEEWRLDFAPPIMFLGLVLFAVQRVPAAVAAVVGGLVSLIAVGLQDRLGIVIGAVAGVAAGTVAEHLVGSRRSHTEPADLVAEDLREVGS